MSSKRLKEALRRWGGVLGAETPHPAILGTRVVRSLRKKRGSPITGASRKVSWKNSFLCLFEPISILFLAQALG